MKMLKRTGSIGHLLAAMLLALSLCMSSQAAEQVTVTAAVESREVYVGEVFVLQIMVDGSESPEEPDMKALLGDFGVQFMGGQQNSSSSVSIINGRMQRQSRHGYVFNYNLTAKHQGKVQVPAILVTADGDQYTTRPFSMLVKAPEESDDFKLRFKVAKNKVYVGEPVELTVTWYVGKDVRDFNFNLPFLESASFDVLPKEVEGVGRDQLVRIPLAPFEVIGVKGNAVVDNQRIMTVTFSFSLFPKNAGDYVLQQGTVSCEYLAGYRQNNRRDQFSGLFDDDFFGGSMLGRSRKVYRTAVVPSNEPQLVVLPLPSKGKPAGFNGLVGDYSLAVSASPLKVKVGDPITLTIQVAGNYIKGVHLPPLKEQLGNGFKVPEEMAPGVVEDQLKTFTQTIRVRRPEVKVIPSISLPFFNVKNGQYETAVSEPIALQVRAVKMVTAQDAEGGAVAVRKSDLQASKGGINYNYEGVDVLTSGGGSAGGNRFVIWYVLLVVPPIFYAVLLCGKIFRDRRRNNPKLRAARLAHSVFRQELGDLKNRGDVSGTELYGLVALAIRQYLAARSGVNSASITYDEVEPTLLEMGVASADLLSLREVFEQCEAVHFSGGVAGGDFSHLQAKALEVINAIEQGITRKG